MIDPAAIVIRHAEPGDLDALERLEDAVFPIDCLSRRSLRYYVSARTAVFLVATRGTDVVGDAIVAFRPRSSRARLYSLAIDPAATGQGIGRTLLTHCEAEASHHGATEMCLEVRAGNTRAIGLYEASGYAVFGRYENYYEDGAEALRMVKPLRRPLQSEGR